MKALLSIVATGNRERGLLPELAVRRIRRAGVVFCEDRSAHRLTGSLPRDHAELRPLDPDRSDDSIREQWSRAAAEHSFLVHLISGDFESSRQPRGGLPDPAKIGLRYELVPSPGWITRLTGFGETAPLQNTGGSFGVVDLWEDPNGDPDWARLARMDTLLIRDRGGSPSLAARQLIDAGRSPDTPAFVLQDGGRPGQRSRHCSLRALADHPVSSDAPENEVVILAGSSPPASRREPWWERRPLFGKRILVTRPRAGNDRLVEMLREQGADVVHVPTIAIQPLDEGLNALNAALDDLTNYDWLVFTSRNGVRYFFEVLFRKNLDARSLGSLQLACIGNGTAGELERHALKADLVPKEFRAESLVEDLNRASNKPSSFLLPRASGARPVLPDRLEQHGHRVHEIPIYRAQPPESSRQPLREIIDSSRVNMITFTSSSTVDSLFKLVEDQNALTDWLDRIDSSAIGPITASTLREHGVDVDLISDRYDFPNYTRAIVRYYTDEEPIPIREGDPL